MASQWSCIIQIVYVRDQNLNIQGLQEDFLKLFDYERAVSTFIKQEFSHELNALSNKQYESYLAFWNVL